MRDKDRTPIDTTRNILSFEVTQKTGSFYLVSAEAKNRSTIILNFNLPVDSISAKQKSNYQFEPSLEIETIIFSDDYPAQVALIIRKDQLINRRYVVTVQNTFSQSGLAFETGQGSQTFLFFPSDATLKIFAYPNPCRVSSGKESINFANVSKSQTVKILTISGETIRTLTNSSINNDLVWDLKNENSETVGSGIYIFLVKNEKGQQVGKLAIVR